MKTKKDLSPKTLDEAINRIVDNLSKEEIKVIKKQSSALFHFTSGMNIRNNWSLWEKDTPIKKDIAARFGLSHADDCSGLIFAGVWAKIRELNSEKKLAKTAKEYKDHWIRNGVDPLTQEMFDSDKFFSNKTYEFKFKKT